MYSIYSRLYKKYKHRCVAVSGRAACIESLISWGADVDYDIPHLGTPLYIACASQQLQCTQKLLDGGELIRLPFKPNKKMELFGVFWCAEVRSSHLYFWSCLYDHKRICFS